MRGVAFRGGYHDFSIRRGGLDVYPRLVAAEHQRTFEDRNVTTGNPGLDTLLGGGLPVGTSTLLLGPAGTGKSTVTTQLAVAARRAASAPPSSPSTRTPVPSAPARASWAWTWHRPSPVAC